MPKNKKPPNDQKAKNFSIRYDSIDGNTEIQKPNGATPGDPEYIVTPGEKSDLPYDKIDDGDTDLKKRAKPEESEEEKEQKNILQEIAREKRETIKQEMEKKLRELDQKNLVSADEFLEMSNEIGALFVQYQKIKFQVEVKGFGQRIPEAEKAEFYKIGMQFVGAKQALDKAGEDIYSRYDKRKAYDAMVSTKEKYKEKLENIGQYVKEAQAEAQARTARSAKKVGKIMGQDAEAELLLRQNKNRLKVEKILGLGGIQPSEKGFFKKLAKAAEAVKSKFPKRTKP